MTVVTSDSQGGIAGRHSGYRGASTRGVILGASQVGYLNQRQFQVGDRFWAPLTELSWVPSRDASLLLDFKIFFTKIKLQRIRFLVTLTLGLLVNKLLLRKTRIVASLVKSSPFVG